MRDEFRPYSGRPSADAQRRAWNEGLVVLDTGALLGLYRYPKRTSDDLVRVYEALGERVWLPHQAAVEFYRNREGVIAGQEAVFDAAQTAVKRGIEALRTEIEKMASEKEIQDRHSLLDTADLLDPFNDALEKVLRVIGERRGASLTALGDDPVLTTVERLFIERVTPTPSQDDLDTLYGEGADRFDKAVPPGYKDRKEKAGKTFQFGGLQFQREYGDLAVWKQALTVAQDRGASALIVVTDDRKEDWWAKESGRTLGPRREMVEEAYGAGIETLLLYHPQGVLEVGAEFLGVAIGAGSAAGAAPPPPPPLRDLFPAATQWTLPVDPVAPSLRTALSNSELAEALWRNLEAHRAADAPSPSGRQLTLIEQIRRASLQPPLAPDGSEGQPDGSADPNNNA